jgi:hypothetical protein
MPGFFQNITGQGIFNGNTKNGGSVTNGIFNGSATNTGTVDTGVFQGKSKNQGTANTAYVGPNATNEGTINNTLSNNNVNKITHPTGEYVYVDNPPAAGVSLWSSDEYVDCVVDGKLNGTPCTLPPTAFIQIPELGDAYWGVSDNVYSQLITIHANQPPYESVCRFVSDGNGGYITEWPAPGTSLWGKAIYRLRYNANNNFTLPPVAFISIPEIGNAYWGIDNAPGIAGQPPYDAVCSYEAGVNGSYVKHYPPRLTTLWDSWLYKERLRVDPSLTIPNAEFVEIPELGDAYWGVQDDSRPDSFLQGSLGQPPWQAVGSYVVVNNNGDYAVQWTHWGTMLWDEQIYKYRVDNDSSYTIPAAAFISIPELGDVYWGPYQGYATGIENQPPLHAVANYRTPSQPGLGGGGLYVKRWYTHKIIGDAVLWTKEKYSSMLLQRPNYALSESAFVNIPELGNMYWTGVHPNQPPLISIVEYYLREILNNVSVVKKWPTFDSVLWDSSNYTSKLAINPSVALPEEAYIEIPELGSAYWTGLTPGQPPLVSIATYKSAENGSFYRSWALAGVDLWGPDDYAAKLAS